MRLAIPLIILLLVFAFYVDSKRSGGSRGRSRGSSTGFSFWNRKSKSSSDSKPKPIASAPKESEIKKQTANVQQSAPPKQTANVQQSPPMQNTQNQRPIGWNVDSNNNMQKQNVNPSYNAPNPHGTGGYPHNPGGYPGYGYGQTSGAYGQPGGAYGHMSGGYGQPGSYPRHAPGYYPGQAPGYYPGHYPGQAPGYYPGHYPGYSQQPGLFGGSKHGYGSLGGLGGMAAPFAYGYGMKKSGGFFGKHAFRNILGGLAVWYLVSGLISTPYRVYNFYNRPREQREEITLPANMLTLCNENATNICAPGTTAICTQDNQILCVTSMTSVTPCKDNNGELCVNSTIPCVDSDDPLCKNKTTTDNTTTINLPCFTNMTLQGNTGVLSNLSLPTNETNMFCVTTMAVPDPTIPVPDNKNVTIPEISTTNTGEINGTLPMPNGTFPMFYGMPYGYGVPPPNTPVFNGSFPFPMFYGMPYGYPYGGIPLPPSNITEFNESFPMGNTAGFNKTMSMETEIPSTDTTEFNGTLPSN